MTDEDDYLVRVRAQVMSRDASTEGWLPLTGGGLANVSVRKRAKLPPEIGGFEYIIFGQRISDQAIILSCVINNDLLYYKVMPTFHHWQSGKQRNGLTFNTAADARAFDKGVIKAYGYVMDKMALNPQWQAAYKQKYDEQAGEDDVFMTLDLPAKTKELTDLKYNSDSSTNGERQNIHIISCEKPPTSPTQTTTIMTSSNINPSSIQQPIIQPGDNYSYVQLTGVHEYNYPVVDEPVGSVITSQRESMQRKRSSPLETSIGGGGGGVTGVTGVTGVHHLTGGIRTQDIEPMPIRLRCKYCQQFYTEESNRKGSCESAPDNCKSNIDRVTGMLCARCMIYHCMSDAEGETAQHPCECGWENACAKRWIGITLLSFIVPCLWCYPPLRACHWFGVKCGICGGKHKSLQV